MQGSVYINREELKEKLEKLKIEKDNMSLLFSKVTNDVIKIPDYWRGDTGNSAYENLSNYIKYYPTIIAEIESYIKFLENTLRAYQVMDNTINQRIDDNASDAQNS